MYELLNLSHGNYQPLGFDDLVAESDVIALGTIVGVRDGRTFDFSKGASNPSYTSVLEIEISEVAKGPAATSLAYVEIDRAPAITSDDLQASLPGTPMLVFLKPAPAAEAFVGSTVTDASEKRRGSDPLMQLTTPQGLLVEGKSDGVPQLRTPLETNSKLFDPDDENIPGDFSAAADAIAAII